MRATEGETMRQAISPSTGKRYGLARVCRVWGVARSRVPGTGTRRLSLERGGGPWGPGRMTHWWTISGVSWRRRLSRVKAPVRWARLR